MPLSSNTTAQSDKIKAEFRRRPSHSLDTRQKHVKTLADEAAAEKKKKAEKRELDTQKRTERAQKRSLLEILILVQHQKVVYLNHRRNQKQNNHRLSNQLSVN